MKKVILLFALSRFLFLANYPHFYDSPEYYQLSQKGFFESITLSHQSVHPVYLFVSQLFQKISILITGQPSPFALSFISALFGLVGFISFLFLIKRLFNKKIAIAGGFALIFFPHLWIVQTNIMHEAVEQGLFLAGLLTFDIFLQNYQQRKTDQKIKVYVSVLATIVLWSLAILNFPGTIIWFPVIFGFTFLRLKLSIKNLFPPAITIVLSLIAGFAFLYLVLPSNIIDPNKRIAELVFSYGASNIFSDWNFINLIRTARNIFLISWHGYSPFTIILAALIIAGIIKIKAVNKKLLIILVISFLIPFFITGKFWYGGLYGRYSSLIGYFFALVVGLIKSKKIYWGYIALLITFFLSTFLAFQKTPFPIIQQEIINKAKIDKNNLLILSDYQRPQLNFTNALYIVNDLNKKEIVKTIENNLKENKRVYISKQALTFPYWQYDGQQIHIISKNNNKKGLLEKSLENFKLNLISEDNKYPLLSIYEINY